jgi:hypothetical protein
MPLELFCRKLLPIPYSILHEIVDTNAVTLKKNKESYSLIRPVTPAVPFLLNGPAFNYDTKIRLDKVTYIKTDDKCVCDNELIEGEYWRNKEESKKKKKTATSTSCQVPSCFWKIH